VLFMPRYNYLFLKDKYIFSVFPFVCNLPLFLKLNLLCLFNFIFGYRLK